LAWSANSGRKVFGVTLSGRSGQKGRLCMRERAATKGDRECNNVVCGAGTRTKVGVERTSPGRFWRVGTSAKRGK
jgi:hypothetical protein